jgi:hypothetical protein
MTILRFALYLALPFLAAVQPVAQVQSQIIQGPELEEFLAKAEIVEAKTMSTGITAPKKLTMVLNGETRYGVFKTVDESKSLMRFDDGRVEMDFKDSWEYEIAAYEIDKIVGLGMVPATVERTYKGSKGSVQFFVNSMMTQGEQIKQKARPVNIDHWTLQVYKVRLFDNLVYNTDRNLGNLLITKDWEIILIDHSRAFRAFGMLRATDDLTRFSRTLLAGIQKLDLKTLTEKTGKYLPKPHIEGMLKRRDLILESARKLAAQKGDHVAYYE